MTAPKKTAGAMSSSAVRTLVLATVALGILIAACFATAACLLRFDLDRTFAAHDELDALLKSPRVARDLRPDDEDEGDR